MLVSIKAWAIYENFFNQLSVTNASVFDYAAGTEDTHARWTEGGRI